MELEKRCKHEGAYLEKACCSIANRGDSGNVECACGGRDYVVCPAEHCDGISEDEVEALFLSLEAA